MFQIVLIRLQIMWMDVCKPCQTIFMTDFVVSFGWVSRLARNYL